MATATDPTTQTVDPTTGLPGTLPPTTPGTPQPTTTTPGNGTVGLINQPPQATPPSPYTAAQVAAPAPATAQGYDPSAFTVTKPMTVQGQIEQIAGKNTPLMQEAQARSLADMQSRGLINSSLAVEAGQKAVLDTALPIAQQDAQTNYQAMVNTQNAQNAEKNMAAQAQNQVAQFNAQLGVNVATTNAASANKALSDAFASQTQFGLANLDTATKTMLANLDTQTKIALTTIDDQYKQLFQTNSNAQAEFSQVAQAIAAISQNNTMNPAAKDAAIASQLNLLNEGLKQAAAVASTNPGDVGNLNLSQFFVSGPGGLISQTPETGAPAAGTTPPAPGAAPTTDVTGQPLPNGSAAEAAAQVQPAQYGMSQLPNGWWAGNGGQYPSASAVLLAMGLVFNGTQWVQGPSMTG